jgi:hypothetical protein
MMETAIVRYSAPLMLIRHECCACHEPLSCYIGEPGAKKDGRWQAISHGICKACARRLYGAHADTQKPARAAA